LKLGL